MYLLLVTVADAQGLSYWGDARVARLLHMPAERLARSREELIAEGLVAYERPLYQVLALDAPTAASIPTSMSSPASASPPASPPGLPADRQQLLQRLARLGNSLKAPR